MRTSTVEAFDVSADPILGFDLMNWFAGVLATLAGLIVVVLLMFVASTQATFGGTTGMCSAKEPTSRTLSQVDFLFPGSRKNFGREDDGIGVGDFFGNGAIGV